MAHKRRIFGCREQLRVVDAADCRCGYPNNKRAQVKQRRRTVDLVGEENMETTH